MADLEIIDRRLAEVDEALHQLVTGRREVAVGYDGKQVTFTQARLQDLQRYRADLLAARARLTGGSVRRPVVLEH